MYWFNYIGITYGKKGHKIWSERSKPLVRIHQLNNKEMFVVTQIEIRYVVVSIVLFIVMLAIELFNLTQIRSFIGCFFE